MDYLHECLTDILFKNNTINNRGGHTGHIKPPPGTEPGGGFMFYEYVNIIPAKAKSIAAKICQST